VGNLVCPASYDLGEHLRCVILSVTEGEDKPLKYPTIFNTADVAVITKIDLAGAVEFDREAIERNVQTVRPGMRTLAVSAKTGEGMGELVALMEAGIT
jgi:hydrogenase nickel incorporation protein HypB